MSTHLLAFLIHCPILITLIWALRQHYKSAPLQQIFVLAVLYRMAMGIAFGWLHIFVYGGGDTLNYYRDAAALGQLATQNTAAYFDVMLWHAYYPIQGFHSDLWLEPRAFVMVKWVSVLFLWCMGNYWVMSLYLSLLSAWAMWRLANTLTILYPNTRLAASIALLFVPSAAFWASGVSKESWAIAMIGWVVAEAMRPLISKARQPVYIISLRLMWVMLALLMLWQIKFYYLAILLPCLVAYWVSYTLIQYAGAYSSLAVLRKTWAAYTCFLVMWISMGLSATSLHSTLSWGYFRYALVYNHNSTYIHSPPNDLIHYSIYPIQGYVSLDAAPASLLYNAPWACYSAIFRPLFWESGDSKLKLLMGIENTFLWLLAMVALVGLLRLRRTLPLRDGLWILTAVVYVVVLLTILAFASPNFGALTRYRVAAHWVVWYSVLSMALPVLLPKNWQQLSHTTKGKSV